MSQARSVRERLAGILSAAFAEGLLSEQTHSHRLGLLFGAQLVDPDALVGDLALRNPQRTLRTPASAGAAVRRYAAMILRGTRSAVAPLVLALDWTGERDALVIGRDAGCDIELREATVSRRHARLLFRDGAWIIQDLESTNGTTVNAGTSAAASCSPAITLSWDSRPSRSTEPRGAPVTVKVSANLCEVAEAPAGSASVRDERGAPD